MTTRSFSARQLATLIEEKALSKTLQERWEAKSEQKVRRHINAVTMLKPMFWVCFVCMLVYASAFLAIISVKPVDPVSLLLLGLASFLGFLALVTGTPMAINGLMLAPFSRDYAKLLKHFDKRSGEIAHMSIDELLNMADVDLTNAALVVLRAEDLFREDPENSELKRYESDARDLIKERYNTFLAFKLVADPTLAYKYYYQKAAELYAAEKAALAPVQTAA